MNSIATTIEVNIVAPQIAVFEHIVPIDLTSIFTGYGPLPAVIGVKNQTGAWNSAGQTRTVTLSDKSSANEVLIKYDHPNYFGYTVSDFTGSLRFLTLSANGEWWFSSNSSGTTQIKWRYAFLPRSFFAVPVLWLITNVLWRGYMLKALNLSKYQIESRAT